MSLQDKIQELEAREKRLHEMLAEDTQRLRVARAQVVLCEESLQKRLDDLGILREQLLEAKKLASPIWN